MLISRALRRPATPPEIDTDLLDENTMTDPQDKDRWPHIGALLDSPEGHITLGHMPPIEGAAIAVDHQGLLVSLVRRPGESFVELLRRLDDAIGKAVHEGTVTNEINGGRFRLAPSGIRKKR
jgi:hypothetical protein